MVMKRLAYINEHRVAVGRPRLPATTSEKNIRRHLAKIDLFAPYGADPWADYPMRDIAALKEAERARVEVQ